MSVHTKGPPQRFCPNNFIKHIRALVCRKQPVLSEERVLKLLDVCKGHDEVGQVPVHESSLLVLTLSHHVGFDAEQVLELGGTDKLDGLGNVVQQEA